MLGASPACLPDPAWPAFRFRASMPIGEREHVVGRNGRSLAARAKALGAPARGESGIKVERGSEGGECV